MTRLKTLAMTSLVAATIGVGGLAAAPSASAMPRYTCSQAIALSKTYIATGDVFYALGNYSTASQWYGRAQGIVEAAC